MPEANQLVVADYLIIGSFFVVMIATGMYFRGRMKSMLDFFGGGKQVPWWLAGVSFFMCSFSALGFVAYSALAYQYGLVAITIYWLTVPATLVSVYFLAARWRRVGKTSPLEYIETRYGKTMRQGLVWLGIPAQVLDDGLKLLAIGTIISVSFGFPIYWAIVLSGIIIVIYTFLGGLWAAVVADFIQFVILAAAVLVLPFLVLYQVGGVGAFIEGVPPGFFDWVTGDYTWGYLLAFFVVILLNRSHVWALVQRYYAVASDRDARKAGYLVAVLNIIGPPLFYAPAMFFRVLRPELESVNMNEVYAILCTTVLPIGLLGLVIAAMFAATMSMVAGDINAIASVLTNDVYKRLISRDGTTQSYLLMGRINTLIVGVAIIFITFLIMNWQGTQDLLRVMVRIFAVFTPPVAIPMVAGMLTKKTSNAGALAGLTAGVTAGLSVFALGAWYPDLRHETVLIPITCTVTLLGMILGSLLKPDSTARKQEVSAFIDQINAPDVFIPVRASTSPFSPLPIMGAGIMFISLVLILATTILEGPRDAWMSVAVGLGMGLVGAAMYLKGKNHLRDQANATAPLEPEEVSNR
jgi:solute:Na+ symporter, SSS family